EKNDYVVDIVSDGLVAKAKIISDQPDLVILDIQLPGKNGMDACREVRSAYKGPILMLTALDDDMDQMLGLELGADDYIVKPVQPRLLLTRIRALLRRILFSGNSVSSLSSSVIRAGALHIDINNRRVSINEDEIELTSAEYELLLLLAQDLGHVVERDTIVQELRGFEYDGLDRSVDRRISRLRKKLIACSKSAVIKTVRGRGYQLCVGFD
ncbi:MAG: winged helix-turn-helix domain-containing protein, partial [Arenicella sp.]|nr:winged helix-turn-helix domain-containing protein [Arenicella sp.]